MTGQPQDTFDGGLSEDPTHDPQQGHAPLKAPAKTATPTPTRRPNKLKPGKLPPWKVVLHNDQINGMEDVVVTIKMLTPLSEQAAVRRMLEAHLRGRAMLLTTHRERAELYKNQFASRGLTVTIGPV
jgi:ATP-dependent Clp protease adaptor protein ClpS